MTTQAPVQENTCKHAMYTMTSIYNYVKKFSNIPTIQSMTFTPCTYDDMYTYIKNKCV